MRARGHWPMLSGLLLAQSVGPRVLRTKDAGVEMYTETALKSARVAAAAHSASAHGNGARSSAVNAIFLVHVQDEADIRLRSGDARDGPSVPRRGRASKVQAHVVTLVAGRSRREIPTELEALGGHICSNFSNVLGGTVAQHSQLHN